jgi:hypothetical protein
MHIVNYEELGHEQAKWLPLAGSLEVQILPERTQEPSDYYRLGLVDRLGLIKMLSAFLF